MKKKAILLLTMGGPSSLAEVGPFLFRLFSDPAILPLPKVFRIPLAWLIAKARKKKAQSIYEGLGGKSPLPAETKELAARLECEGTRVFMGFCYAAPLIEKAVAEIEAYGPQEIVLLPLYPQYSLTTTQPALDRARKAIEKRKIKADVKEIRSYQEAEGLIEALAQSVKEAAQGHGSFRFLFSAHSLPEACVKRGDPYPKQCAQTARKLAQKLGLGEEDWILCYQSRLGPIKWMGPFLGDEIERAGKDGKNVLVVPISFVTEGSETKDELDKVYAQKAREEKVPHYARALTPARQSAFLNLLKELSGIS